MPERKATKKIRTETVQGPHSWVIVKPLTFGDVYEVGVTEAHLKAHVLEWNWVDDLGTPLQPPSDPAVWDRLTLAEVNHLLEVLGGAESRKIRGQILYTHLFTGGEDPPRGWGLLQLCLHVYQCLPSQLLAEDAITILDHIEFLNQEQKVKDFGTNPTHSG